MFLSIIGIIVGWFVAGVIINILYYGGLPEEYHGKNDNAKSLHIIINIIAVILIFVVIIKK